MNHSPLVEALLEWGQANRRDLPWRRTRDPWAILVSEVMLQQTQVERVILRYEEFLERFPTPAACAQSPSADVIEMWSGLGYNRRPLNLWRAANAIVDNFDGRVPDELRDLLALAGVGPYTARAVLVFAFERDLGVVDTNVGRLLARWSSRGLSAADAQVEADRLVPTNDGWAWNQTLFDFANLVCRKRSPECNQCPIAESCKWRGIGPDPATRSAGVSTRQSRFEGSAREVRGRIVEVLRRGPHPVGALRSDLRRDLPGRSNRELDAIIEGLVSDGLITRNGELLSLPGSPSANSHTSDFKL